MLKINTLGNFGMHFTYPAFHNCSISFYRMNNRLPRRYLVVSLDI